MLQCLCWQSSPVYMELVHWEQMKTLCVPVFIQHTLSDMKCKAPFTSLWEKQHKTDRMWIVKSWSSLQAFREHSGFPTSGSDWFTMVLSMNKTSILRLWYFCHYGCRVSMMCEVLVKSCLRAVNIPRWIHTFTICTMNGCYILVFGADMNDSELI